MNNVKNRGEVIEIKEYINRILRLLKGFPVSLEVIGTSSEEMVSEGIKLYEMFNPVAKNVYIKIPVNPSFEESDGKGLEGVSAIRELSSQGIPVNCTLIFTPEQALLAAKSGARFVSPFVGRIDDYIRKNNGIEFEKTDYFPWDGMVRDDDLLEDNGVISGVDLVAQIVEIFRTYDIKNTLVLAASIRNARQVREVALAGADIATLPFDVIKQLLEHYKTREGMKLFTEDIVPEYRDLIGG